MDKCAVKLWVGPKYGAVEVEDCSANGNVFDSCV